MLVMDHGSPWLPADSENRVHFSRSGGQKVATLDLPEGGGVSKNGRIHTSYALIIDHAVYAIFNQHQDEAGDKPPYFVIEADGLTWLAWPPQQENVLVNLYDEVPASLAVIGDPSELDLVEVSGQIRQADGAYHFTITLPDQQFRHAALIALALIFLIESQNKK